MSIYRDKATGQWQWEFSKRINGQRFRKRHLLPAGWTQAEADAYDRKESAALYAIATGIAKPRPLIDQAVARYLIERKPQLKAGANTERELNATRNWWTGRPIDELAEVTSAWLRDLAKLSAFDGGPRLAQEYLSKHGISLVFEKHFKKTYLDGAAMLDGEQPIVALTLRHDRVDNFWFALLHELIHVAKHLRPSHLFIADNLDDKTRKGQTEEDEADAGAQEALIPMSLWKNSSVFRTHAPEDAIALAREAGVHPAIVAGRLRFETGNWRLLSGLVSSADSVRQHFAEQFA